jgi:hypothetical protein
MSFDFLTLIAGAVWIVVTVVLLVAYNLGFRFGRRRRAAGDDAAQLGTVQGALLGLLGLLLAFSFSAAAGRFAERQRLVLDEANAIGTTYLRADMLPSPHRQALRSGLVNYTRARVAFYDAGVDVKAVDAAIATSERIHGELWATAIAGVKEAPVATIVVLNPLNEVIDLHSSRVDALYRHLPAAIVALLLVTAMLAVGCVGVGAGMAETRRSVANAAFLIVTIAVLGLTLDLDYPRAGIVRAGQRPMLTLLDGLTK